MEQSDLPLPSHTATEEAERMMEYAYPTIRPLTIRVRTETGAFLLVATYLAAHGGFYPSSYSDSR
jgi:hypothetical protein